MLNVARIKEEIFEKPVANEISLNIFLIPPSCGEKASAIPREKPQLSIAYYMRSLSTS